MPTEAEGGPVNKQAGQSIRDLFDSFETAEDAELAEDEELAGALLSEGCEVASSGSKFLITTSDADLVKDIFLQHGMSFAIRSSHKPRKRGHTEIETSDLGHEHVGARLLWKSKEIKYFGKPFYVSKTIILDCINGRKHKSSQASSSTANADEDETLETALKTIQTTPLHVGPPLRKKKKKSKKSDCSEVGNPLKTTRKRLQPSKKLDCPGRMRITVLTVYPQYELFKSPEYLRKQKMRELREALKAKAGVVTERRYFIVVSKFSEHNHSILTSLMTQTLDPRMKSLIKKYVDRGITNTATLKILLEEHAKENFKGVPFSARSFYPTKETISNHVLKFAGPKSKKIKVEGNRSKEATSNFIELYRQHRCLWDVNHLMYKDHESTIHAYDSLLQFYRNHIDGDATMALVKRKVKSLKPTWKNVEPVDAFPKGLRGQARKRASVSTHTSPPNRSPKMSPADVGNTNSDDEKVGIMDDNSSSNGVWEKDEFGSTQYMEVYEEIEIEGTSECEQYSTVPSKIIKEIVETDSPLTPNTPNEEQPQGDHSWESMGQRLRSVNPEQRAIAMKLINETVQCAESGTLDENWILTPPIVFNIIQ